jgi:hypothetical protein
MEREELHKRAKNRTTKKTVVSPWIIRAFV